MHFNEFIDRLKALENRPLPGDDAHLQMTPYKKGLKVSPENPRLSAVMITVYPEQEDAKILLLKRSEYGGVHSAQVGFPGGKKDEADKTLLQTALRELKEETGIDSNTLDLKGELTPMFIPPSNFMVHPYIGVCENSPIIKLDEREVQYHFSIKVSELVDDNFLRTTDIKTSYGAIKDVPYFHLNNEIIWGATAAILNELKLILIT